MSEGQTSQSKADQVHPSCFYSLASVLVLLAAIGLSALMLFSTPGWGVIGAGYFASILMVGCAFLSALCAAHAIGRNERCKIIAILMLVILTTSVIYLQWAERGTSLPEDAMPYAVVTMDHDVSDTFVRNVRLDREDLGNARRGQRALWNSDLPKKVYLPARWRPGLTLSAEWDRCEQTGIRLEWRAMSCRHFELEIPVQKYAEEDGSAVLHFLPGDQVLFIVSRFAPGDREYPGPSITEAFPDDVFERTVGVVDDLQGTHPLATGVDSLVELHIGGIQLQRTLYENRSVFMPYKWHPGLAKTVKWRRCKKGASDQSESPKQSCHWTERLVPVQEYDALGSSVLLHLMEGDQALLTSATDESRRSDTPREDDPLANAAEGPT